MSRPSFPRRVPEMGLLALLAVAELMLTLDLSIVNVALPSIRGDLGFEPSSLQWVVNGYALTFAGFLLLGGRLADLFGGRRVFLGALSAFSVASLACGLAADEASLVGARVVQGLSAGVLAPGTLSILTSTYREPETRTRALAIWTAAAIGGGAVGGLLGGLLTDALSWRCVFFVNVPVGAALLAAATRRLPLTATQGAHHEVDVAGAITATGGLTALTWGLIRAGETGWGAPEVTGGFALAAVLLGAFALLEIRVAHAPLVPFSVFRSRPVSAGNMLSFLSFVPVMATWFFLTLYLQGVRGYTPMQTGLLFLPMSLAVVGASQVGFRVIARLDARALFFAGGAIGAAGLLWLAQLTAATDVVWVIVPASIAMVGGGMMFAPVVLAGTSGTAPGHGGLASGLLNTSRQIGGALGLAVLGTIAAGDGYAAAFEVGAAVYGATAIVGALALPARLAARTRRGATARRGSSSAGSRDPGRPTSARGRGSPGGRGRRSRGPSARRPATGR
jgi:EmrB/QacA subfamily drug resistance transporter